MPTIIDDILSFIPYSSVFEISFGLIISAVLYFIDRSGKKRQEETLNRQDESLDIILEQVSKVNIFQTKTLSLAIESLGKDLDLFRNDLEEFKKLYREGDKPKQEIKKLSDQENDNITIPEVHSPITSLSSNFGNVLSKQINNFVDQIKSNLSELTQTGDENKKNIYKVKKGLEFDIKDLFNIQTMLNEMKSEQSNSEEIKESQDYDKKPSEVKDENFNKKSNKDEYSNQNSVKYKKEKRKLDNKFDFDEFNLELDKLQSIPELVRLTESMIKKFEPHKFTEKEFSETGKKSTEKRRIKPNKIISSNSNDS
jgi:hypothetical protein